MEGIKRNKNGNLKSVFKFFDCYRMKICTTKLFLFGEDRENYGKIVVKGKNHPPKKINLQVLGKHIDGNKLFKKVFKLTIPHRNSNRSKIKKELELYHSLKDYSYKSVEMKSHKRVILSPIKNKNEPKLNLSPRIEHINKLNNSILNFSPQKKTYNIKNILSSDNLKKKESKIRNSNKLEKITNLSFLNENQLSKINQDKKESFSASKDNFFLGNFNDALLFRNTLNDLEKKATKSSIDFQKNIYKRAQQNPQLRLRYKYIISQYKI